MFQTVRDGFGRQTDVLLMPALHQLMSEGVSAVLEAVNEMYTDVGILTEGLGSHYYARSTANAYASFGSTSGFGVHNDDHDVIVLQIEGRKKWRFFGTPDSLSKATIAHLSEPSESDVSEEMILNKGEIIFIPKGT